MEIRKLRVDELKKALFLVWVVFEEFEAPNYSQEGKVKFSQVIHYERTLQQVKDGELSFWGCFLSDETSWCYCHKGEFAYLSFVCPF